jgi:hypothetical protein
LSYLFEALVEDAVTADLTGSAEAERRFTGFDGYGGGTGEAGAATIVFFVAITVEN